MTTTEGLATVHLLSQVEEEVREGKEALKKVQSKLLQLGSSLTMQQAAEQLAEVRDVRKGTGVEISPIIACRDVYKETLK